VAKEIRKGREACSRTGAYQIPQRTEKVNFQPFMPSTQAPDGATTS
jgi:hypothetical protein